MFFKTSPAHHSSLIVHHANAGLVLACWTSYRHRSLDHHGGLVVQVVFCKTSPAHHSSLVHHGGLVLRESSRMGKVYNTYCVF